jgi:hypothetical protein
MKEIEAKSQDKEIDELDLSHDFGSAQIYMISVKNCRDVQ